MKAHSKRVVKDMVDRKARLLNQDWLHALSVDRTKDVNLFCSHDAIELKAFADSFSSFQS